jgi:iron complex outermembrane recepter protein
MGRGVGMRGPREKKSAGARKHEKKGDTPKNNRSVRHPRMVPKLNTSVISHEEHVTVIITRFMLPCPGTLVLAGVLLATAAPSFGQVAAKSSAPGLVDLSLEELMNLEVTSVSGRAESLQTAAASVYVISAQEIRRSAATTLPEALRLAPNLQVAQVAGTQWAISSRGFNNPIGNKLLVLIDGRTVYSSLFSGVFWDVNEVALEDVDRIEVISGPGGTIWGANAVNGVINVITKAASASQGLLASVTAGKDGRRTVARWGAPLGSTGHIRVYALHHQQDPTRLADGSRRIDERSRSQVGFRSDLQLDGAELTVQGDAYRGGNSPPAGNLEPDVHGGNLLARWTSRFADGSPYKVQAYYDLADRNESFVLRNRASTVDLQFSHEPQLGSGNLLWGAGVRRSQDDNIPTALVLFSPEKRGLGWANIFAQYQFTVGDRLRVTAGVKAERNSYTGLEWLPSLKVAYSHSPESTTWASASRAVRAPARLDRDFYFPGGPPFVIAGGPNFRSETATVMELGHRGQSGDKLSYSVTAFSQRYKGLRAGIPGEVPSVVNNQIEGPSYGLEAWGALQAARNWRLSAGLLLQRKDLRFSSGATDATSIPNLGNDPRHQFMLRSSHELGKGTELDVVMRRVGALPNPQVASYTAVDARISRQLTPNLRFALVGQNLTDSKHVEFDPAATTSQIERRVMLQVTWTP